MIPVASPRPVGSSPEKDAEPLQSSPGLSERRLSSSRESDSMSSGDPNAWAARFISSSRCSGVMEFSIRWAAAERSARVSSSSSRFCGFSGNWSPCFCMNSSKSSGGVLPHPALLEQLVEVAEHVADRLAVGIRRPLEGVLHSGEPLVEQLTAEQLLDALVVGARRGALPVVVRQVVHGGRGAGRQVLEPHLGERPVVVVHVDIVGEPLALFEHGVVEELANLLQRAVEPVTAHQFGAPLAHASRQVVETLLVAGAAAQVLAHRALGRGARHDLAPDRLERLLHRHRRRERIRPAVVASVPVGVRRYAVESANHQRSSPSPGR